MEDEKTEKKPPSLPPPWRMMGEHELQEMVGKGTFVEVFRVAHLPTSAHVAVKEIDRRHVDDFVHRGILQEMSILGSLRPIDTIAG